MQVDRDFPVFTCFPILLVYLEINKFSSHKAILNHEIASIDIIDDYCLLFTAYCSLLTVHCLLFTARCSPPYQIF